VSVETDVAAAVAAAITELGHEYPSVSWEADGSGGAYVTVGPVALGSRWRPSEAQITFQLAFNYPHAAVYPFFTVPELERIDGGAWPSALQKVAWRDQQVVQISLRANRWQPAYDTASSILALVGHWFRTTA
jgi:hypothetical protein